MKKIIVTGASGQAGSLMIGYLLQNTDALIYAVVRQLSVPNHINLRPYLNENRVRFINSDITDPHSMDNIIKEIKPDYFINFAAASYVATSWDRPAHTIDTNVISVINQLEAIRKYSPMTRYYQSSSSEMFGNVDYTPQDEKHPFKPRSPYGVSKVAAHLMVKVYRESYGLYAVCGICFNFESKNRGFHFFTRKITLGIGNIKKEILAKKPVSPIEVGNLDTARDWQHCNDVLNAVWRMLNQDEFNPEFNWSAKNVKDYVVASGELHTAREFIEKAFKMAEIKIVNTNAENLSPVFDNNGRQIIYSLEDGQPVVVVNPSLYRPADVFTLCGDSSLIRKELGWKPKYSFDELVCEMVSNDFPTPAEN